MILKHRVEPARDGTRLSVFLHRDMELANGYIARLKPLQAIRVNGQPAHTDYILAAGDLVEVDLAAPPPDFPPEDGPLDILYEDEAILAVNKPAGMVIHPSPARLTGTLANRVLGYYQAGGQQCAVHILTRLDRDTCGIVLLGKNAWVQDRLTRALRTGQLHKSYLAPVLGGPAAEMGLWDWPIVRPDPRGQRRAVGAGGQPARTRYAVVSRQQGWSLLRLRPETGRTHQLRVHCLQAGCPILGDPMYATAASMGTSAALGWPYQHLLAQQLTLPHPVTGQQLTLTAPVPPDFLPQTAEPFTPRMC